MHFYRLDFEYLGDNVEITPKIPNNYWTKMGVEDNKTPRICVTNTLRQSLMAISAPIENKILYVYGAVTDLYIKAKNVPDAKLTNEYWILAPTRFEFMFKILVTNPIEPFKYIVDGKQYELWSFDYKYLP